MSLFNELLLSAKNKNEAQIEDEVSREIFNNSPQLILIVDRDAKIIAVNDRIQEWLDYKPEDVTDHNILELPFVDENARNIIREKFGRRIYGSKIDAYVLTLFKRDGEPFRAEINGALVKDPFGEIAGEILMISDANELWLLAKEEQNASDSLRFLTASALEFSALKFGDDIFHEIAEGLSRLSGCQIMLSKYIKEDDQFEIVHVAGRDGQELEINNFSSLSQELIFPKCQREALMAGSFVQIKEVRSYAECYLPSINSAAKSGLKQVYAVAFVWKEELFGTALFFADDQSSIHPDTLLAFTHQSSIALKKSIDEKELAKYRSGLEKLVEEKTADLERMNQDLKKFELAVRDASDHIIITNPKGRIVYANGGAERITGYSFDQMKGKTPAIWGGLMDEKFYKDFWETINSKKVFLGEIKNRRNGGDEYFAEVHVSPVLDDKGEIVYFVGIERDITKAKEVDQAKTEFVSLASHQLRTPLSAINWYTEMLMDGDAGEINEDQKSYLNEIYHGSQRMVDLVNSLLNVSRLELGTFIIEPQKASLEAICKDVLKELESMILKKQQEVTAHYDSKVPEILVDPKLTRIIFQNLLSNAVKYTPDKGKVGVNIEINPENNKEVKITVRDTGYGIPKYQQDRIFTKLFRADNVKRMEAEGTGLGVYIIKQIVDKAGGKIWFTSEENKGSTFYITIPLSGMKKKEGDRELG